MPAESLTPRVQREVLEELADDDYRDSAGRAGALGNALSHTQAGRLLVEAGEQLHAEFFGPDAECQPADNPADVLILEGDFSPLPHRRGRQIVRRFRCHRR
jgi:hypothetical protein